MRIVDIEKKMSICMLIKLFMEDRSDVRHLQITTEKGQFLDFVTDNFYSTHLSF